MATIEHLNPDTLPRNPAFSWGVSVTGPAKTIYVGGQNGVGPDGQVVADELGGQTTRALRNVEAVLAEAGAELTDVVMWTITMTAGDVMAGFRAFQAVWGDRTDPPPAISVLQVAAMANPAFLVEISAIAAIDG